jgi:hypothetical protein
MLIIKEYMTTITHSDWHSSNERKFRIDLLGVNDFKLIINAMKKHTRLAKKEIVGDVTVDHAQLNPVALEQGLVEVIDYKRFIIHEGFKVTVMIFNPMTSLFEPREVKTFETIYEITNYIFNDIHEDLKKSKKALDQAMYL